MSLAESLEAAAVAAGVHGFLPCTSSYACAHPSSQVVPLASVVPPAQRTLLSHERAAAIFRAVAAGTRLPPVEVDCPPDSTPGTYRLRNGFHRYHASAYLGFSHVPVVVLPYFSWNDL